MIKSNSVDRQKALDYVVYMMVSGNFRQSTMNSIIFERKLFLQYSELKKETLEVLEAHCARLADDIIPRFCPDEIWDENVKVSVRQDNKLGCSEIYFHGKDWCLCLKGKFINERKQDFYFRLITKDDLNPKYHRVKTYKEKVRKASGNKEAGNKGSGDKASGQPASRRKTAKIAA